MNCNAQLVINLTDWRLAAQPAISAPRIDCSTPELLLSWRFPAETVKALEKMGHRVGIRDERLMTGDFASPAAVRMTLDGVFDGGADPFYFPATARAVRSLSPVAMTMRKPSSCSAFSAAGVVAFTGSATLRRPATAPSTTTNITVSP